MMRERDFRDRWGRRCGRWSGREEDDGGVSEALPTCRSALGRPATTARDEAEGRLRRTARLPEL